ncbi:hypothetical protein [Lutimonas vermicola]|uniref:Transposase n=1 Tax=Lutimonas vermicola TaxID=414288 RepID=A0ABU9L3N8_9FLAO
MTKMIRPTFGIQYHLILLEAAITHKRACFERINLTWRTAIKATYGFVSCNFDIKQTLI